MRETEKGGRQTASGREGETHGGSWLSNGKANLIAVKTCERRKGDGVRRKAAEPAM